MLHTRRVTHESCVQKYTVTLKFCYAHSQLGAHLRYAGGFIPVILASLYGYRYAGCFIPVILASLSVFALTSSFSAVFAFRCFCFLIFNVLLSGVASRFSWHVGAPPLVTSSLSDSPLPYCRYLSSELRSLPLLPAVTRQTQFHLVCSTRLA